MNVTWVRIRSWHAVRTYTRVVPVEVNATSDTLPSGRSCESCLRIVARMGDTG